MHIAYQCGYATIAFYEESQSLRLDIAHVPEHSLLFYLCNALSPCPLKELRADIYAYMKTCTRCKESKNESEFAKSGKYLRSHCNPCRKLERMGKPDPTQSLRNKRYKPKLLKINREFVKEYLTNHACIDCGNNDWRVLEFDHITNKKKGIASMMRSYTLDALKEEIKKCEVRCANCHRLKTYLTLGAWRLL